MVGLTDDIENLFSNTFDVKPKLKLGEWDQDEVKERSIIQDVQRFLKTTGEKEIEYFRKKYVMRRFEMHQSEEGE